MPRNQNRKAVIRPLTVTHFAAPRWRRLSADALSIVILTIPGLLNPAARQRSWLKSSGVNFLELVSNLINQRYLSEKILLLANSRIKAIYFDYRERCMRLLF